MDIQTTDVKRMQKLKQMLDVGCNEYIDMKFNKLYIDDI